MFQHYHRVMMMAKQNDQVAMMQEIGSLPAKLAEYGSGHRHQLVFGLQQLATTVCHQ
jgi:hypothetical protein